MKANEWENITAEFNNYDVNTLLDSQFNSITAVHITELILDFFGNAPLPPDFLARCDECISDINNICSQITENIKLKHDEVSITKIFAYLGKPTHAPHSVAINALLTYMANNSAKVPAIPPTPATRQKALELITLSFVINQFGAMFYQQNKPFYALCCKNKALEVLGGAKFLYGLSQDSILKIGMLSDDESHAIFKEREREQGRMYALKATEPQRQAKQELGKRYLQIMINKGFSSYEQAANYIWVHDNPENKAHRYITTALSQADQAQKEKTK